MNSLEGIEMLFEWEVCILKDIDYQFKVHYKL